MIKVKIASEERIVSLSSIDEQWINQQINRRKANGQIVCVRVTIDEGDLHVALATPTCGSSGGSRRSPNSQERKVLELWNDRHLNEPDFTGGNLIAFFKQLRRYC